MKIKDLAEKTFCTFAPDENSDKDLEITGAAGLDTAKQGEIAFLANPKYTPQIKTTSASAIFLNENEQIERDDITVLRSKNPYLAYTRALRIFYPEKTFEKNINRLASIHETAKIADDVSIDAFAVIGKNCEIASGAKIFPNATIYDGAKIGENTIIHSGVSIRENCEVGANCIIHN
ncbi:MAG: hypothetical protein H7Z37_02690 [Pyrinomonadaceae bacterium]|nr:hypothetical protein [Pyrinomonadaceae bacterium]